MRTLYTEGLDSEGFEQLCEEIFSAFYKAKVKRSFLFENSNTDFVVLSSDRIAVDCRHPAKSPIGRPAVEKFFLAMKSRKVREGIIVTSGRFAGTAQKHVEENDLPITLVDMEKLAAMAYKAGIKLVYKKEEPEAFTIISNSDREFREHLAKRLKQELMCSEDIGLNVTILSRNITRVPFYRINYRVDAEFEASGKIIHREKGEGYFYVSERTGKIEDGSFAKIFDMVPRMAYTPEGKEAGLLKPRKQITESLYDRVRSVHTKYIPYITGSDKPGVKTCIPSKKDITVQNIMCLFLPVSDVEYELFGKSRNIRSLESSSDDFIVVEPSRHICDICGGRFAAGGTVCVKCGNIADAKHGVKCTRCGKTLCVSCAFYVSRFLGKKEPICGACANKETGAKIKSYK
ncbi:MAG: restriction endonuclease [Candidatus Methanoplasma sp.]|nr:restriction endonuclease [Candidatus Methanoplasma sp.]